MANYSSINFSFLLFLVCPLLFLQGTLGGEIVCEELPTDVCAFSIASSGKRCLLENNYIPNNNGKIEYECRTSQVVVERLSEHIETDQCVHACGVDRKTVGISTDAFFEPHFAAKLCSPACYQNCPNIVDLYFHLAAAEGVFLPKMCEAQKRNPRRVMVEQLLSNSDSGSVAPAPFTSQDEEAQLVAAHSPQIAPAASSFELILI